MNAGFLHSSVLGPTLYCDQALDMLQQLKLTSEL